MEEGVGSRANTFSVAYGIVLSCLSFKLRRRAHRCVRQQPDLVRYRGGWRLFISSLMFVRLVWRIRGLIAVGDAFTTFPARR